LPVIIAAGSRQPPEVPFDLTVSIAPPGLGATCANPTPLSNGTFLPAEDLNSATVTLSACVPAATGPNRFYSATIPSQQSLTAVATPLGNQSVVLRVLSACGANRCLASSGDFPPPPPTSSTLTYLNTSTAARSVVLAVGGFSGSSGTYSLSVSIAAAP